MDAACFDRLASAFLAVHEDEGEGDFSAFTLDGVDGFERRAAGGDDVIHDDYNIAVLEVAFDLFACAVAFGFLADGEDLERFGGVFHGRSHADGEGNGVCAESHAAYGVDLELFGVDLGTYGVPAEVANEQGSEGIECRDTAVDVEVALGTGSQGEIAGADRFF